MANLLTDVVWPAASSRFVLLANHVLAAAPPAVDRLRRHAGRQLTIEVQGWRLPWPMPPALVLRVTPAGLLETVEAVGGEPAADLRVSVDGTQPLGTALRLAAGEPPAVQIEGDAGLAGDMNWILAHVRWDIAADLERVFGPAVADVLSRGGSQAATAARGVAQGLAGIMRRP